MSVPAAHRRRRWLTVLGVCALVLALAGLGGCMRARVAVAVGTDDLVTGEVVVATVMNSEDDQGRVVQPPPDLTAKVRTEPYREDDYAGTRMLFSGLTFEEFGRINQVQGGESERLELKLRRSGQLVLFNGFVDLTQSPVDNPPDVQVRLSFPGRITATNGLQEDQTITWTPGPNTITEMTATVRYAEPGTRTWQEWAIAVGGLAGIVVLMIIGLALLAHRRYVRQAAETG